MALTSATVVDVAAARRRPAPAPAGSSSLPGSGAARPVDGRRRRPYAEFARPLPVTPDSMSGETRALDSPAADAGSRRLGADEVTAAVDGHNVAAAEARGIGGGLRAAPAHGRDGSDVGGGRAVPEGGLGDASLALGYQGSGGGGRAVPEGGEQEATEAAGGGDGERQHGLVAYGRVDGIEKFTRVECEVREPEWMRGLGSAGAAGGC